MVVSTNSNGGKPRLDREFLERAINTMEDIFVVFLPDGALLSWNQAARTVTGYSDEEAAGMNIAQLLDEEDREKAMAAVASGIESGYAIVELELVCKDGHSIPYEFYGTPLTDRDGSAFAVTVIGRDISVRRRLIEKEREVAAAQAQTEAAGRYAGELRDLITIAAHELRHPATVFKGYANLMMSHKLVPGDRGFDEALKAISASADRLAYLVTELFETSLIEQEGVMLERVRVLPGQLISGAMDRVRDYGVDCCYEPHPAGGEMSAIAVDPDRVCEVLAILIENAVKFSPGGGSVGVWCEQENGTTVFHVADRGPGVAEQHRDRIFERFYQVEDTMHHSKPGIGLGLNIARRIVEAHDGWISVSPRDGGGSVFSFGLPNSP